MLAGAIERAETPPIKEERYVEFGKALSGVDSGCHVCSAPYRGWDVAVAFSKICRHYCIVATRSVISTRSGKASLSIPVEAS